jgi:GAF domain-containing protein/HAMP domain-containing protein
MRNSIRTRLAIAFIALTASLLLLVGLVMAWQSYVTEQEQVLALQSERARRISTAVLSYMQLQENALDQLVFIRGLGTLDHDQQTQVLSELVSYSNAFNKLTLLSNNGLELIAISRTEVISQLDNLSTDVEFTYPKSTKQIYYSPVRLSEKTGEPYILISVPIMNLQSGSVTNVLVAEVGFKPVWDLLANLALGEKNNAYIVDAENRVIAHNDPSVVLRNTLFTIPAQDGVHTGLDGTNVVLATDRFKLGNWEFTVVTETPTSAAFANIIRTEMTLLALLLVAIGIAGALGWFTAQQIVQPIESLVKTAQDISAGDLSKLVEVTVTRHDEIGTLAEAFNSMVSQLRKLYRSLELQVQERTRQIRTAAEVAQGITTSFNLDELLQTTVKLIVERFGFYHAGIFLIDSSGRHASLRAAHGPSVDELMKRDHQLEVGSDSIVGWASANLKPRVAADVDQDSVYRKNPLLPNTRAEAGFPIALGGVALGVLDVQSTEPQVFDEEMVIVLQTLANQLATAIQNTTLSDSAKIDVSDAERLYRVSHEIAQAESEDTALAAAGRVMKESPHPSILMQLSEQGGEVMSINNPIHLKGAVVGQKFNIKIQDYAYQLHTPTLVNDLSKTENLPMGLTRPLRDIGCKSGAFLPVLVQGQPSAMLLIGEQPGQPLTSMVVRPYTGITDMLGATLEKIKILQDQKARLAELEALASFNQVALSLNDETTFYASLQAQVQRVIGRYSFLVALYDEKTNSINIPYLYEEGKIQTIEPLPLGEGLTSILIRTRQSLLLVEDTEKKALAMGAKIQGQPARSWMGVPLLINEKPIGALIVQDLENDHSFDERDLHFLEELGRQLAGVIQNTRLLDQSRQSALQLQTAAEIARDISGSLNLDELLLRGVNLIRDRFSFYHASIFLLDLRGEYAVIREATGDAGAQMKRIGHKLAVGSKSIVGYVSGRGESLVVNDTLKDATYYANPILPDSRSEAAIPLKVGERIVGVLDVQSTHPYSFTEENMRTLELLADQLAVAVVNTELFSETQEHLSQQRLLHHITTSAASGATLEDALDTSVKGLQVTLGGDRVSILLLDKDPKILEMRASMGYSEEAANIRVPVDTGITGWVAAHRKPLRIDDVTKDPRYISVSENTRSELALPLIYRNELLGVLNVESEQVAAYTENDEEMLGTLAGSLAAVIANARLVAQIRRQAERERLLYEVTSKIRRSTDMQTILATTASELTMAIGARHAHIKIDSGEQGNNNSERTD